MGAESEKSSQKMVCYIAGDYTEALDIKNRRESGNLKLHCFAGLLASQAVLARRFPGNPC